MDQLSNLRLEEPGGTLKRQHRLECFQQALEIGIQFPVFQLDNIKTTGMLRVEMKNLHGIYCADTHDRDDQRVTQHLQSIHDLTLLRRRASKHGVEFVDDQHSNLQLSKSVNHLVPKCKRRVCSSVWHPKLFKD
ncbi:hypothetical protein ALP15_200160 [Pseudomonas savastanoi]|nr:hypothetical protein ALO74_200014 [Pseudomonas syringae pv. cunninghamiae]RMV24264.1 hypothetical protein ALP15_200160 [Pseudomonas savastanoi]